MATLSFTYITKCNAADPHIVLDAKINGVARKRIAFTLSDLQTRTPEEHEVLLDAVSEFLVRSFARKWKADNPSGTLAQMRTALEAQAWEV